MENNLSKDLSLKLKALQLINQIIGGLIGLALTIALIAQQATISGLLLLLFLAAIGLYLHSIYSGTLLLKKKAK